MLESPLPRWVVLGSLGLTGPAAAVGCASVAEGGPVSGGFASGGSAGAAAVPSTGAAATGSSAGNATAGARPNGGGEGVGGSGGAGGGNEAAGSGGVARGDPAGAGGAYVCDGAGSSLQFDGDQIDEVVADLMTDMPAGDASRTVEMWAYTTPKTWRLHHFLFDVGTTGGGKVFGVTFGGRWENSVVVQGGYPDFEIFTDKTNGYGIAAPWTPPEPNFAETGWVHMAVSYSTETKQYAFITNGKTMFQGSSILHDMPAFRTEATPLHIGFSEGFGPEGFDGKIDELRIWNIARTNEEIVSAMHSVLNGNEAGLVGNWHFDEGAGTVARDSTSGHHDAIMISAIHPTWVKSEGLTLTCP